MPRPELLTKPEIIIDDDSFSCEDCPEINPNPPDKSECPYFDNSGEVPICNRQDGFQAELRKFIGGTGTNLGKLICTVELER